jgi:exopolyphosphatase/guanosine-5'-triphosphate,3'-diphosphate pyrophosphatase
MKGMKFGAIDIGTNAARLLIGEVTEDDGSSFVQKISYSRIPLRLGEEVFDNGKISEKKTKDFVKSIKAFKLISDVFDVKELRACATSAMREADNGKEVRDLIEKETGVNIEVISGDEEAELIFGTFFLLDFDKTVPFIVVDVGGGSTEVSVFERGERVASRSFKVGTLRMLKGKTSPDIWTEIREWIKKHVDLKELHQIYATGGNINKTHKILGGRFMEPISWKQLKELWSELNLLTLEQRIKRYQFKPDRADVIVPALEIYLYILKELRCREVIVPKIGLSDGMIYDMHSRSIQFIDE